MISDKKVEVKEENFLEDEGIVLSDEQMRIIARYTADLIIDELKPISSRKWDTKPKPDGWWNQYFALVRQIISKKGYATTSDISADPKLSEDFPDSQRIIRLFEKMNREDDIRLFKQNPDNQRSPWILTIKNNEKAIKNRFRRKREKAGKRPW